MSESEPGPAGRRLRALLDRLAVEEDPKEAARLMRELARLTEAVGRGEAVEAPTLAGEPVRVQAEPPAA